MPMTTCAFLLLLMGFAYPSLSSKCPDPNELPATINITCDSWIEVQGNYSTLDDLTKALSLLDRSTMVQVTLNNMILKTLPSKLFNGLKVMNLKINDCELDSLAPQGQMALASLEDKLTVLRIASSFKEDIQVTKIDLRHLHRLTYLELTSNSITEVGNDWFSTSLNHLELVDNRIEKIGNRAFANQVNLEELDLIGNRFGPIKRSMLPRPAYKLKKLVLKNNAFTSFPEDLFKDMPVLKELYISENGLIHLPEKTFRPIWRQLSFISTYGNPLECDSKMEWLFNAKLPSLLTGMCRAPLDKKGMKLEDFIRNKGKVIAKPTATEHLFL